MNELKEKMNNIHGITLITLAVTIMVLLILAGVTISALTGDDGIIKQSKLATEETSEKVAREEIKRIVTEYELTSRSQTLEEFLKTKIPDRIDSVINNGDGTLTVKKGEYSVTVENKTNSSGGSSSGGSTGGETQTPEITVGEIKVAADSTGTGTAITANSVYLGNTLYITFVHSITGGTTVVDKTIPYAVTKNGTYTFTVTGTVNGKSYTKNVSVIVNQFKDVYEYMQTNTKVTYSDGEVWIPEGFRISTDSASTVQGGIVIEDKDLNQFVWVPVATLADYKRTWYTGFQSFSGYSEALPEDEKTSVERYKGFYIGRYEAGDKESTGTTKATFRTSSSGADNAVTIKADQVPYNFVTRTQAVSLAEGFATKQGYKAKTKLVSSYAWDTTIAFIEKTVNNYGSSSSQGNYKDTSVTYKDITDESKPEKTKAKNSSLLVATGQTTPVCNIYDMGGNLYEWTTESYSDMFNPYAGRGGNYNVDFANYPAGYRGIISDDVYGVSGFRLTLFM